LFRVFLLFRFNSDRINIRNEEGLMILSKYPVVNAQTLLLSREVGNEKLVVSRFLVYFWGFQTVLLEMIISELFSLFR
jgi:hypothetical protein